MSSDFTWRRTVAIAAIVALATVGVASAQRSGSIYGVINDENGVGLPGVTVRCEGMGAPRLIVTDDRGNYRFLNLDPGAYYVRAEMDGFSTVEQPNVIVALNRNTTINFTLSSAVEDVITVTSESPLLDERSLRAGANISAIELEKIPSGRDPWSVMNQAPGVLVDRVNVGGNEGGQQSNFRGPGTTFSQNDFLVDGVQITDMAAIGASPTYYDFEQFEAVELSTGGADVSKNSAGVSVNMVTRRGTNEFRGTARFLSAKGDGLGFLSQSHSDFNCNDLGANQDCDTFGLKSINSITEYGFEAGGPAVTDRLWFWGSYGVSDIQQFSAGGGADNTILENTAVKANGQITSSNSALGSWNNGDKKKFGRGAGPGRAQETTWDQRGPSAIWKFEDTHVFNSNFYLTGAYSKTDLGFSLTTKATLASAGAPETLWAADGVWRQNYQSGFSRRPAQEIKIDGSYFFNTGNTSHELKFGGRVRETDSASNFVWGGNGVVNIAGENFGGDGAIDYLFVLREADLQVITTDYNSLWAQDTISGGNWTLNAGFRWDDQSGNIGSGTTIPVLPPFDQFLPELSAAAKDPGFSWGSIVPRIGFTYALGEERDTLLRASFSQFAEALGIGTVSQTNPATYSYANFSFIDGNGDDNWQAGEPYYFLYSSGFNVDDPLQVVNSVDRGLDPEMVTELILGVEHSFMPEFVVGANFTFRTIDDIRQSENLISGPGINSALGRPWTAADFVSDGFSGQTLPTVIADGSTRSVETFTLSPDFSRTGGTHLFNGSRSRDYTGFAVNFNKRLSNGWGLRGFINVGDTTWNVPASYQANTDPNDFQSGSDNDGAIFFERSSGSGRGDIYTQASWQANLTGMYQVAIDRPWGFLISGNIYAREGYPVPYDQRVRGSADSILRNISLLGKNVDKFRVDDVLTTDLRVEKEFSSSGNTTLTLGIDLFNALNEATVLAREPTLTGGTADNVQDLISPRTWKIGVRISWR